MNVDLPGLFKWLAEKEWEQIESCAHPIVATTGCLKIGQYHHPVFKVFADFLAAAPQTIAELAVELIRHDVSAGYANKEEEALEYYSIDPSHYCAVVEKLQKVRGR